ncbi:MAG: TerB family tellurite resistance protein [Bacteroidetes bacterium]|nr:TerB family tellurite resistance protein [Bacteroidota bacterium]
MAKYGKWIGAGLGWAMGGPIGAILGFAMGSYFDDSSKSSGRPGSTVSNDFSVSLLILAAAVIKADGKVDQRELDYVRRFFDQQFGPAHTRERMNMLDGILKQDYSIRQVCLQIKQFTDHPSRLQLVHFLFGISKADGEVHRKEIAQIEMMAGYLGISQADFNSIKAMFYKETSSYYSILEIKKTATDTEVKKAYRKMAVKYHPDKVSHLGEEFKKSAKEKFLKVQEAYESIKKERGMS